MTARPLEAPSLAEIRDAADRIRPLVVRTPLVRLHVDAPAELWLKLETLQPIGSFKLRGAAYAMLTAPRSMIERGVYTASAGNMAQGVAWVAREFDVPCTAIVPEHAPATKLAAIERLGARVVKVPYDRWWQVLLDHEMPGVEGMFIHPVADRRVIAGNGTVGLEIADDLPAWSDASGSAASEGTDAVLVPFGGGGLAVGVATALRAVRPAVRVYGCEVETAAPLRASLAAGHAVAVSHTPSFVDGIGGKSVLSAMWPLVNGRIHGALVSSLREVADAVRLLVERGRVVTEGAGAAAVAAALRGVPETRRLVAVVSGGNIDRDKLARILSGEVP